MGRGSLPGDEIPWGVNYRVGGSGGKEVGDQFSSPPPRFFQDADYCLAVDFDATRDDYIVVENVIAENRLMS